MRGYGAVEGEIWTLVQDGETRQNVELSDGLEY